MLLPGGTWDRVWLRLLCCACKGPLHTHWIPIFGIFRFVNLSSHSIFELRSWDMRRWWHWGAWLSGNGGLPDRCSWWSFSALMILWFYSEVDIHDLLKPPSLTEGLSLTFDHTWKFGSSVDAKIGAAFLKIWLIVTHYSENVESDIFGESIQLTD